MFGLKSMCEILFWMDLRAQCEIAKGKRDRFTHAV